MFFKVLRTVCFQISQRPFFRNGQNKPNQTRLRVQVMYVLLNFVSEVSEELFYDLTQLLLLNRGDTYKVHVGAQICPHNSKAMFVFRPCIEKYDCVTQYKA